MHPYGGLSPFLTYAHAHTHAHVDDTTCMLTLI